MGFKEFFHDGFPDWLLREVNEMPQMVAPVAPVAPVASQVVKPWSAKKPEILQLWRNLRNNLPILVTPIENLSASKESYGEDGIRISGSWQFIAGVLSRLKDLMTYENPQTRLRLIFRGVAKPGEPLQKPNYVFYFNVEQRGSGRRTIKPPVQKGL